MDEDLNLSGNRYTIMVLVFFPFYILFNPVATVLARKLGPRPFLTGITLAFGLVVIGFGLVDDWEVLMGLRMLLGVFESCFFPSALFLVSMWYLRREVAKRNAFFYLIGNSVGGFGGLLAFGLQQMAGVQGHAGWQWIFLWEGIITIIIAIIGFIFLVDFPEDAHKSKFFLKDDEIKIMIDRVDRDRGDAHITKFNIRSYLAEGKDWKVWCFAINFGLSGTKQTECLAIIMSADSFTGLVTYSISYFLPIILRDTLGFSVALAQCLTAPVSKLFLY
jgi:MFS family permease